MIDNDGWNALYIENHDQGRSVSRFASSHPDYRVLSSKMLATFLALQAGTVFVYQGQELAMANVPEDWDLDRFRDIECLNHWALTEPLLKGDAEAIAEQKKRYHMVSRDNARTPMQWNSTAHAGFTSANATPWMDVHENYREWNAEKQVADKTSPYWYWSSVLRTRKDNVDVFVYGNFALVSAEDENVLAYKRVFEGAEAMVVCNFQDREVQWDVEEAERKLLDGRTLLANYGSEAPKGERVTLRPFETFVVCNF